MIAQLRTPTAPDPTLNRRDPMTTSNEQSDPADNLPAALTGFAVELSDQVLVQQVQEEMVLLDLASNQYFGLDPVGTRIWTLLAEGCDLAAVRATLLAEYDVTAAVLDPDLVALLEALADAGLVRLRRTAAAG